MALSLMGCASRGAIESLEAELREKDDRIVALEGELTKTRGDLEIARRETQTLRQQVSPHGGALLEEQTQVLSRVEKIRFHPLLTTGVKSNGSTGDEKLSVLLMPVDRDGELLRLPGKVDLELFDMTQPAEQQRIGQWSFTPVQTRAHWQRSLLCAGYQFKLDWQTPPKSSELTLHGRLTIADGRQFDTTSQVKVRLANSGSEVDRSSLTTRGEAKGAPAGDDLEEVPKRPAARSGPARSSGSGAIQRVSHRLSPTEPDENLAPLKAPPRPRRIITSDSFTEATIPRFR